MKERDDEFEVLDLEPDFGGKFDISELGDIDVRDEREALAALGAADAPGSFEPFSIDGFGFPAGTCELVGNSTAMPFRAIALLRINLPPELNREPLRGTAFFIKPGLLLTAGHNVFPGRIRPASIDVMTAFNGQSVTKAFRCRTFSAAPEYIASPGPETDYGMIFLGRDIGVGNFGAVVADDGDLLDLRVELIGYPSPDLRQSHCEGIVRRVESDTVRYSVPTDGGSSGGPIFLSTANPRVVAIHVRGPFGNLNEGTRLTDRKLAQIRRWIQNGPT